VTTASSADHGTRRDFLFVATGAAAAVGSLATLWPFVSQMNPDATTIAAGAPIEVDLTPIASGQDIKVFWRGKPIYIMNRTKKQVDEARQVPVSSLPDPATDQSRVKEGHDQWLVVIGICTHLGCIPIAHDRNTTPPVAFAKGPRPPIWRCRPISSFPIANSRSASLGSNSEASRHRVVVFPQGSHHERTIRLPTDQSRLAVD